MPKCKVCKSVFKPLFSSLQKTCTKPGCVHTWYLLNKDKADQNVLKDREKQARSEKIQGRERLKTKSDYERELQAEINAIVRLIDFGHTCIATGTMNGKMNAGHFLSVGSHPSVRFNLLNIWIQSEHSNSHKSGDSLRYRDGLEELYGKEFTDNLYAHLKQTEPIKLSIEELKEKKRIAKNIISTYKKLWEHLTLTTADRLNMRIEFNNRIGIYKPLTNNG